MIAFLPVLLGTILTVTKEPPHQMTEAERQALADLRVMSTPEQGRRLEETDADTSGLLGQSPQETPAEELARLSAKYPNFSLLLQLEQQARQARADYYRAFFTISISWLALIFGTFFTGQWIMKPGS